MSEWADADLAPTALQARWRSRVGEQFTPSTAQLERIQCLMRHVRDDWGDGQALRLLLPSVRSTRRLGMRADERHLPGESVAFGFGVHYCIGAGLVRPEARVALEELLRAMPRFRVAGPVEWRTAILTRGPLALPIAVRT